MSKRKCGLCGKTKKLTKTECCDNWICDDEDKYVIFSYARNSCHRNHDRYTLCAYHFHEGHQEPDWRNCKECITEDGTDMTTWYATNEYNFVKMENPPQYAPTHCKRCNHRIIMGEEGYCVAGDDYYCEPCIPFIPRPGFPAAGPQVGQPGPQAQPQDQEQSQTSTELALRSRSLSQPLPQLGLNPFASSDSDSSDSGLPLFGLPGLNLGLNPESESDLESGSENEQAQFQLTFLDFINFLKSLNDPQRTIQGLQENPGRATIGTTTQPRTGTQNRSSTRKSAPKRESRAKSAANRSSKSKSPAKPGRKKSTSKRQWVWYGENPENKPAPAQRGRSKKPSNSRANSASKQRKTKTATSRSKSTGKMKIETKPNGGKYGKRKAEPTQPKTKKLRQNKSTQSRNKKSVQASGTGKSPRASSSSAIRDKSQGAASKKSNSRTNSTNKRSSSIEKPQQKKKVQGSKKRN